MKKYLKSAILILVLLFAGSLCMMGYSKTVKMRRSEAAMELAELQNQINYYKEQLELLEKDYSPLLNGGSCVIMAFTNLAKGAAENVLYLMDKYGYAGLMVFVDGRTPGDANCITAEEYEKLLENGWEAAIGSDSGLIMDEFASGYRLEKWREYLEGVLQEFRDKGLSVPAIYCFNEGEDNIEAGYMLPELGFETYIRIYDDPAKGWFSAAAAGENVLSGVQADYEYRTFETDLDVYREMKFSTVLLFNRIVYGAPKQNVSTNTSLLRFEETLKALESAGDAVLVTTPGGYGACRRQWDSSVSELRLTYEAEKAAILQKISDLRERISGLRLKTGFW